MIKIIGECGVNFRTMEEAKRMIDECKRIGLWAAKFQVYDDTIIREHPQQDFLKSIMLNEDRCKELFEHGQGIGQEVFFTPMFLEAIDWLGEIGVNYYKIRFADRDNLGFEIKIKRIARLFFKSINQISGQWGNEKQLYCVPKYPARLEDYPDRLYDLDYQGYSDHTPDCQLLKRAMAHDVEYFEKHVCLTTDCLESKWSVTFEELEEVLK